ncbi:Tox-REase-5 domain-containing protein [Archangium sp. Cb G35]|uniref:Tox-REase-5 domain-containing protein n=1 Tax=Archangium sp. Cb G35 TaxID=1920190 RepID=UPI0009F8A25C|nr:Tox-REase-5 domain-containing protein [Archangium sp. Cb G35]
MRLPTPAALLAAVLLLASGALAAEPDEFQQLLRHSGLPQSVQLASGQSLAPEKAQALWRGLVDSPANLRTFAPRTTLARLLREASATNQPLPYAELLARTARFRPLVVARPDGYCAVALTGTPISWLGQPTLQQGELYVQHMRVGAFHFDGGGVYFTVDEALRKQHSPPVGERALGRDPATAALLGTEAALEEMARGLAALLSEPVRTLEGLAHLPLSVAGLIANSPEYFARYGAMNLEDQIREASRVTTHLLTLQGGAATVGPRLASATKLPVLTLSARGTLAVNEVAVPAGAMTAVVGAGAAPVSIVLMAQGSEVTGSGNSWPPPPEGPGQWIQKAETMSDDAKRFQSEMTGAPEGWVYRVHTGPGPTDFVDFDGFKNGVLLEVKGPGYKALLEKMYGKKWFRGAEDMIAQARRQFRAANGTPIQWHFAEKDVSDLMRGQFQNRGLSQIEVHP